MREQRCEPEPCGQPASGPSQRDARDGAAAAAAAGAGLAAVAPGLAGITGLAAGPENAPLFGAVLAAGGTMLRCMPKLRPPPMRVPASAKSAMHEGQRERPRR